MNFTCANCKKTTNVPLFPFLCGCGVRHKSAGLGDHVAAVIHKTTGIKPCGGCQKRKEALNKAGEWIAGVFTTE